MSRVGVRVGYGFVVVEGELEYEKTSLLILVRDVTISKTYPSDQNGHLATDDIQFLFILKEADKKKGSSRLGFELQLNDGVYQYILKQYLTVVILNRVAKRVRAYGPYPYPTYNG